MDHIDLMDYTEPWHSPLSPDDQAERPWTAARCDRLLHRLHSNINALRKLKELEHLIKIPKKQEKERKNGEKDDSDGSNDSAPRLRRRVKHTYSSKTKSELAKMPSNARTRCPNNSNFSTFVLEIPPLLCNTKEAVLESSFKENTLPRRHQEFRPKEICARTFPRPSRRPEYDGESTVMDLKSSKSEHHAKPFQSLVLHLGAVLRQTRNCGDNLRRSGVRSLFSTCLALVPEYIAEETHWSSLDGREYGVDVSSETYSDLENFASSGPPGSGWRPLGEVARSHVIHLLSDAIREGVIGLSDAHTLMNFCIHQHAEDEARMLLDAVLSHVNPQDQSFYYHHGDPECPKIQYSILDALEDFISLAGQYGHVYQRIAQLLEENRFPTSWLRSRLMTSCLNGAIESLTHENYDSTQDDGHSKQAATLLRTVVAKSWMVRDYSLPGKIHTLRLNHSSAEQRQGVSSRPNQTGYDVNAVEVLLEVSDGQKERHTRLDKVAFSTLAVLSAINIVQHMRTAKAKNLIHQPSILSILQQMGLEARQFLEMKTAGRIEDGDPDMPFASQVVLPLLSAGLATVIAHEPTSPTIIKGVPEISKLGLLTLSPATTKDAGSFLFTVARHCAQATTTDAFAFMQTIFGRVNDALKLAEEDTKTWKVLDDIKVASAFAFCEDGYQPAHLEWAMDTEHLVKMTVDAAIIKTPTRTGAQSNNEYRWEEGISEWVERTPVAPVSRPNDPLPSDSKNSSMQMPLPTSTVNQPAQLLSDISPKQETVARRPEVTMTTDKDTGHAKMLCVRIVEKYVPTIDSRNAFQASPQPRASDTFQEMNSGNDSDSDSDELSTPDRSPHESTSLREHPSPREPSSKRQRPIMSMSGASQTTKRVKISTEETPPWIKKRTSLGFRREKRGGEDELGSQ